LLIARRMKMAIAIAAFTSACSLYFGEPKHDPPSATPDAALAPRGTVFGGRCNLPKGLAPGSIALWIYDDGASSLGACIIAADWQGPGSYWCVREFETRLCTSDADCPATATCDHLPRFDSVADPTRVCRPPAQSAPLSVSDLPEPCEIP
jgi:hypothetical protein